MSGKDEIARAYKLVDKVLQPLVKGDGEKADVKAARVAVQALHLLRQWARLGAAMHEAAAAKKVRSPKPTKGRTQ